MRCFFIRVNAWLYSRLEGRGGKGRGRMRGSDGGSRESDGGEEK